MEQGPKNSSCWFAGELAAAAGVSTDTLRHYERKGVLPRPARSANGYRRYPADAIERVRMVRNALAVGFTLDELARLLAERGRGGAPCREVRAMAAGKLAAIEVQLKNLAAMRDDLKAAISDWDARLANTPSDQPAGLLESLSSPGDKNARHSKFKKR
jgi:DNA-binding transcriptional MerR regulator